MRLTLNHCCIADVEMQEPKPTDNQRKGRRVFINIDEEDFFEMLDHVNPKNIIKYLDMRRIPHRDSLEINVSEVRDLIRDNNICGSDAETPNDLVAELKCDNLQLKAELRALQKRYEELERKKW